MCGKYHFIVTTIKIGCRVGDCKRHVCGNTCAKMHSLMSVNDDQPKHYLKKLTVAGMNRTMTAHVKGCSESVRESIVKVGGGGGRFLGGVVVVFDV